MVAGTFTPGAAAFANRHFTRVAGQSGVSPGAGSSTDLVGWLTASSRASTKVTANAPQSKAALSAVCASSAPRSKDSSRNAAIGDTGKPEPVRLALLNADRAGAPGSGYRYRLSERPRG